MNINNLLLKKINVFSAIPSNSDKLKGIIIYCHGLGSNKNWSKIFYHRIVEVNLGFYAFDFPGHGDDKTLFSQFTLKRCINYLNNVIDYITKNIMFLFTYLDVVLVGL